MIIVDKKYFVKKRIGVFSVKKILISLLFFGVIAMTGCSENESTTNSSTTDMADNPLAGLSEKDVVSEEEEDINGEKFVIKTLKDGSSITLPAGMTIDDAKKQYEAGDDNLSITEENGSSAAD